MPGAGEHEAMPPPSAEGLCLSAEPFFFEEATPRRWRGAASSR